MEYPKPFMKFQIEVSTINLTETSDTTNASE